MNKNRFRKNPVFSAMIVALSCSTSSLAFAQEVQTEDTTAEDYEIIEVSVVISDKIVKSEIW